MADVVFIYPPGEERVEELPDFDKLGWWEASVYSLDFDAPETLQNVVRMDGGTEIRYITFGKFIGLCTSINEPTMDYTRLLIHFYFSFCSSYDLLQALFTRCASLASALHPTDLPRRILSVHLSRDPIVWFRSLNLVKMWMSNHSDLILSEPAVADLLASNLDTLQALSDERICRAAKSLSKTFETLLRRTEVGLPPSMRHPLTKPILPHGAKYSLNDVSPLELVRQLTLMDWANFSKIHTKELVHLGWTKKDSDKRSPNLKHLIASFGRTSKWLKMPYQVKNKESVKMFLRQLQMAVHAKELANVHLLLILVNVLREVDQEIVQQTDVSDRQMLMDLTAQFGPHSGYAGLRKFLREVHPPCIPYLGLYLTDLTFIEEGSGVAPPGGMFSLHKARLSGETFATVAQFQRLAYHTITPVPAIQELIRQSQDEAVNS